MRWGLGSNLGTKPPWIPPEKDVKRRIKMRQIERSIAECGKKTTRKLLLHTSPTFTGTMGLVQHSGNTRKHMFQISLADEAYPRSNVPFLVANKNGNQLQQVSCRGLGLPTTHELRQDRPGPPFFRLPPRRWQAF